MATLTVYPPTSPATDVDGSLSSMNAVYATARAGSGVLLNPWAADVGTIGQHFTGGNYYNYQFFTSFDCSSIADTSVVTSSVISLWPLTDGSTTNFTIEMYLYDWGATVGTEDWNNMTASFTTRTLLATLSYTGGTGSYQSLTDVALSTAVSLTANQKYMFCSDRARAGNIPGGPEYVQIYTGNRTLQTNDPRLVLTYTTMPQSLTIPTIPADHILVDGGPVAAEIPDLDSTDHWFVR